MFRETVKDIEMSNNSRHALVLNNKEQCLLVRLNYVRRVFSAFVVELY